MKLTSSQKIVPFLWFDGKAEEAMKRYTTVFPDSEIVLSHRWGEGTPYPPEWIMSGIIVINGLKVHLFDAGPMFKFNESVSFFVSCKTQKEIDYYWESLTADGGQESYCGWLKDKFGFSWQIVPQFLEEKLLEGNGKRISQMLEAVMKMGKLDVAMMEEAYAR